MKTSRFPAQWVEFEGVTSYSGWRFVAERAFFEAAQSGTREGAPVPGAALESTRVPGASLWEKGR